MFIQGVPSLKIANATKIFSSEITSAFLPLINLSGRVPGSVHIACARCPKTVASTVEIFGPIMYFLSPVNTTENISQPDVTSQLKINK